MRTTLLNPTLWLLGATLVSALAGMRRGEDASRALDRVVRLAVRTPVLAALLVLAVAGLASRTAIGYVSPGAYAEEVLGARAFLDGRGLYGGDARTEFSDWMSPGAEPWTLPGLTPCHTSAMADRPRYYTSQGHPPTLLLASVPIVGVVGGHGLYVVIATASVVLLLLTVPMLLVGSSLGVRSRPALVLGAALLGWQPVLAGVRQGEALVIAAALTVFAWHLARSGKASAGVAGGMAACLTLAATGMVPALLASRLRAGLTAGLVLAAGIAAAMAAGGPGVVADFFDLLLPSARTYAEAANNYAVAGRALVVLDARIVAALLAFAAIATLARGRTVDAALALWLSLGLLVAPITWSQHIVLALVPLAVLLRRLLDGGTARALAIWAVVAAVLSAPDPLAASVYNGLAMLSSSLTGVPAGSVALVVLWLWLLASSERPRPASEATLPAAMA